MSDLWAIILALGVAGGALTARPAPIVVGCLVAAIALVTRRPVVLVIAATLLSSALGAAALHGLRRPPAGRVDAVAVLVSDPKPLGDFVRVEVRVGHRRMVGYGRGSIGIELSQHLAGEGVHIVGRTAPLTGPARRAFAVRHIATRVSIERLADWTRGSVVTRLANELRRTLLRGVAGWPSSSRSLFSGFVLGDDRDQSAVDVDRFRAAGLSHLLVISGENVAFVLTLLGPILRRMTFRPRLAFGLVVLAFLGVLTRWEPSVVRALVMAGVTMTAEVVGRPISTHRALALTIAAVVLLDPLLVRSVGFLLSIGACAGIVLLAPILRRRMPTPVAITLAAQIGVAPVLVPVFGGLPLASIPANLVAVPAAGPLMMWGVVAGLPAGVLGGAVARLLHIPTRVMVGFIALVARIAAGMPLPTMGFGAVAVLSAVVAAVFLARTSRLRRIAASVAIAILVAGVGRQLHTQARPLVGAAIGPGTRVWRSGRAVVLTTDGRNPVALLGALRARGVHRPDVVVVQTRRPIPPRDAIPARLTVVAAPGLHIRVGALVVTAAGDPARATVRLT